jgi:hypothetical protein
VDFNKEIVSWGDREFWGSGRASSDDHAKALRVDARFETQKSSDLSIFL